jgi:hypothetical protein
VHGTTMTEHLLEKPEQTWLTDYTIGYFAADLVLGHVYGGLNLFAGYVHHSVYLALLLFLRTQNQSNLIYLCLPFEIPTMIQSIHTIDKHRYYPILFGSTFVAFRLIGNVAVIYLVYRVSLLYSIIATLMLATHIAWFTDWTKKQISRRITSQPIVGV